VPFRGFLGNQKGVAIIEFAILAPMFFALLLVLIDLSIFFAVHSIVDKSVESAARAVRIGELQGDDVDGTKFRSVLCENIFFLDCNNFSFSVQPTSDLGTVNPTPKVDENGQLEKPGYQKGSSEDLMVITIVYVHRFIIPYAGNIFGDADMVDPQERVITSFLVIKNEPF
jgi:TadE-like protein